MKNREVLLMSCDKKTGSGCCQQAQKPEVTDYLVCTCMGVMYSQICQAIDDGAHSFEALSEQLGVGTGCNSCVTEVHQILQARLKSGCCKT
jgi:bacterioferritin-associated ferredoxin